MYTAAEKEFTMLSKVLVLWSTSTCCWPNKYYHSTLPQECVFEIDIFHRMLHFCETPFRDWHKFESFSIKIIILLKTWVENKVDLWTFHSFLMIQNMQSNGDMRFSYTSGSLKPWSQKEQDELNYQPNIHSEHTFPYSLHFYVYKCL